MKIWAQKTTGARKYAEPVATFAVGSTGDWGPAQVNGQQYYEFELSRPDSAIEQHLYYQPFIRDESRQTTCRYRAAKIAKYVCVDGPSIPSCAQQVEAPGIEPGPENAYRSVRAASHDSEEEHRVASRRS